MTTPNTYKKVDFDMIQIYEFKTILGDNPAVSSGAPIALGPKLKHQSEIEVDFYEFNRGKRRSGKKLMLPVDKRAQILLSSGYSLESIAAATMEADKISRDRQLSAASKKWDGVNQMGERFSRVFKKALGGKKNSIPEKQSVAANSA